MTLNNAEANLLSSLSPAERAAMLKLRFAGLIAKSDNNPHRHKEVQKNLETKEKINRQTDELIKKRKRNEEDPCRQHRPAKWLKTSPEQDHEKYWSAKFTTNNFPCEYQRKSSINSLIHHTPKTNVFNKNVAEEEEEKNKIGNEAARLILQSRRREEREEEEKLNMARKQEIQAQRKAFRESLERMERTVDIDDNFKVMRDFQRLINAPRKVSFNLDNNTHEPSRQQN